MDSFEATKVVYDRVQKLEPEHITKKIIGYILLHDHADREMIRLAFGPDNLIQNLILRAKIELGLASRPVVSPPISPSVNPTSISDLPLRFTPFSPSSPRPLSSPSTFRVAPPCWDPQLVAEPQPIHGADLIPVGYSEESRFQTQIKLVGVKDQLVEPGNHGSLGIPSDYYYPESALSMRNGRHSGSPPEFPVKACHYFNKGFCKHGSSCRYFHGYYFPESHMFGPNSNEAGNDDIVLSPGTLDKLESEIADLLKSRRGNPVSIASLPMLYYEKYGKTLQAEGYLTESQRHGRAGYSLTRLLARLTNSIRLIDRPHGQHSVILAEDAPKYMENRSERNDPGPIVSGSRQIYLTFPAESTFSEEDVSDYFNTFGPVQDVRIPCQQKRMFGFVTFVSADTVKMILSKGNPHYVCGARVLVKPYREKPKLLERKYLEKFEHPVYYHSHVADVDSELQARWKSPRMLRKQLMEEHELALELEQRRLSELHLSSNPLIRQSYFGCSEDHSKFPTAEGFNYLLDVLNSGATSDDPHDTNFTDQNSNQGFDLPDSPFASAIASSISAVI